MMVLSLPMLSNANARARSELCQQNLVEIGQTVTHYARDTNYLPTISNLAPEVDGMSLPEFIGPRVQTTNVLFCPSDETETSQNLGTSYLWGEAFNGQKPGGIYALVGQRMLADRESYDPNSEKPINEIVVTEDGKGYYLSLVTEDPQANTPSSRPIVYLTEKQQTRDKGASQPGGDQ